MLAVIAAALAFVPLELALQTEPRSQPQAVKLRRVFAKGEKAQYEVKASMLAEQRDIVITTFMPETLDYVYKFNYEVTDLKADGICDLRYKRPTLTHTEEAAGDAKPTTKTEQLDFDLLLTVSPVNDLINVKDLKPKKPEKGKGGGLLRLASRSVGSDTQIGGILGQFVGEIQRLALFVGSLESALDFSPKLPYDEEVLPGATWKRTVGYSPQKSSGTGKMAVQRLDFLYTYVGLMDVNGKKVQRVTADLEFKTDLAQFVHETFNVKPADTGLKEAPMQYKAHVEYDLDPKTLRTLMTVAKSEGGFSLKTTTSGNQPLLEQIFKSTCKMRLLTP